jgi:type I restriction enzyme S subunit
MRSVGRIAPANALVWKGAFALASEDNDACCVSNEFLCFEVDRAQILPEYLWNYFARPAVWDQVFELSTGTTAASRNRLKQERFLALTMPLPGLATQRAIVARIDAIRVHMARAREARRLAMTEADALWSSVLRRWRATELERGWDVRDLGAATQVTSGGTPSRENPAFWSGDIPWVKSGELLDGDVDRSAESISRAALGISGVRVFPPDTVLVALYGQGQTRGRTGRLVIEAATNQACCAILPAPGVFEPKYVQFWLRSLYEEMRRESRAGAQPNWNGQMIKEIQIAVPPLAKQRVEAARLTSLEVMLADLRSAQQQSPQLEDVLASELEQSLSPAARL